MDARVRTLTKYAKGYSGDLFFRRDSNGVIHLFRVVRKMKAFDYKNQRYAYSVNDEQHVLSLTTDWSVEAPGADWGIDPVMRKISQMDSWRDDTGYEEFCRRRAAAEETRKQSFKNDIRARAADLRQDFAKAMDGIVVRAGQKPNNIRR